MNEFSFDTEKITELLEELNDNYNEYVNSLSELDREIDNLGLVWKETDKSLYNEFKEKYQEKKPKLNELEIFIKNLITSLNIKNNQIITATIKAKDKFE